LKTVTIFVATLFAYWLCMGPPSQHNEHIVLAYSMLHGHLSVNPFQPWEHVTIGGFVYTVHPPLAALLCLPFVALKFYNQTLISVFYGALAVTACWGMSQRIDRPVDESLEKDGRENCEAKPSENHHALWLTLFFGFGTVVFYEATYGASWGMCSVVATIPTFLVLSELYGKARPLNVGLWAVVACFARNDLVLVLPVYAIWLLWKSRGLIDYFLIVAAGGVLYALINEARFGTLTDPTMWIWYAQDIAGGKRFPWGPFSLHYLPLNIYTALFLGPAYTWQAPFIRPQAIGQSLLTTSPALLLALRAKFWNVEMVLLWSAIVLGMGACMLVWSNGVEQFGARYWIQSFPFFVALIAKTPIDQFAKVLIVASIFLVVAFTMEIRGLGWA
jgi:hypothetical protein